MFNKLKLFLAATLIVSGVAGFLLSSDYRPTLLTDNFQITSAYAGYNSVGSGTSGWPGTSDVKTVTWANSLANALRIGDGTTPVCIYTDATLGPQIRPCTDANVKTIVPATFTWALYDVQNSAAIETVNPSAGTIQGIWTYGTAYKPKKQVFFPAGALFGDGTNCPAAASTVTINSGAPRATFICTNNASSSLYGEVLMPDSWDGSTVTFMWEGIQTAADTNIMNSHIATACRATTVAINNTWGTSQTLNIAAVSGSNKLNTVTSAALTADGTCTGAGTLLQFRWQLDTSTTSAVATLHNLGFKMTYSEKSRSS